MSVGMGMGTRVEVPAKFTDLRPVQEQAIEEIVAAWKRGTRVVIWEAPTGTGKTVGAVAAMARIAQRGLYVCTGKQLQDQFARDFPDARVLKGRGNYPTLTRGVRADQCNKVGAGMESVCSWCDPVGDCPYRVAKQATRKAGLGCVNTSYLLTEANGPGAFSGYPVVTVDEADELEGAVKRHLEFRVGKQTADQLGLVLPKKGVHRATMKFWLRKVAVKASGMIREVTPAKGAPDELWQDAGPALQRWRGVRAGALRMVHAYDEDWVRVYDERDDDAVTLKPVVVDRECERLLWRHADRWLVMSATIATPERFAEDLGLAGHEWEYVESPSTFPKENRPVVVCGVAAMSRKNGDEAVDKMVKGVQAAVDMHPGENVLVHCHTYKLSEVLGEKVKPADGRGVVRYKGASTREETVRRFREKGGVLVAPSLSRGVDLPDDLCRVVVIAKVPFPYLGDPQVSARMNREGGQTWYDVQVVREIVQMCGRGVRHEGDWAVTYVLDGQFLKTVWRRKLLFPAWWREAVVTATAGQVLAGRVKLPARVGAAAEGGAA